MIAIFMNFMGFFVFCSLSVFAVFLRLIVSNVTFLRFFA